MTNVVTCPIAECEERWDATEAARHTDFRCPGCHHGWPQFHDAVDPQPDPEDATIEYPFDGPGGVST
jgi:hypothetical protein